MGLYDVLDQIIDLLRQRKRLTYRLLKREFVLDDETLEDLKDELIKGQRLAVDEDGEVLVWVGETEGTAATTSQPAQTEPSVLLLLAEAYGKADQHEAGLTVLDEALVHVDHTGQHAYEAELHRLRGELLLNADCGLRIAELTPEDCFQKALDVARHQQAKSLELRAATSLARLWQQQGKRQEAYDLLAPVYEWFTEGFDTADLIDAKTLLDELEGSR